MSSWPSNDESRRVIVTIRLHRSVSGMFSTR